MAGWKTEVSQVPGEMHEVGGWSGPLNDILGQCAKSARQQGRHDHHHRLQPQTHRG